MLDISFIFNELGEFSRNIDENFVSADFRRVAGHAHARVLDHLPGGYVVLPTVPGTGNNFILERPLAQRPSPMQARVVDSVELTGHIGERHGFARHVDLVNGARWHFGQYSGAYKRHIRSLLNEKRDARTVSK
jgi:hypothetical protein